MESRKCGQSIRDRKTTQRFPVNELKRGAGSGGIIEPLKGRLTDAAPDGAKIKHESCRKATRLSVPRAPTSTRDHMWAGTRCLTL